MGRSASGSAGAISGNAFDAPAILGDVPVVSSTSDEGATSGFDVAATATLAQGEIGQGVRLNGTRARWVKLRVVSNYGDPKYTQLGEVQVIGKPTRG